MELLVLLGLSLFLYFVFAPSSKELKVLVGRNNIQPEPSRELNNIFLSTTAIGKEVGIAQRAIIQFFIEKGLLERINNRLNVTDLGTRYGGTYHKRGSDSWVVWPKSIIKQAFFKNITLNTQDNLNRYANKKLSLQLENKISYFNIYHPYHGGHNRNFNQFSRHILDLKSDRNNGIDYFFNQLKNVDFDATEAIVIVPSHSPQNKSSTVKRLAQKLAKYKGWIDATDSIVRTHKIDKLS